MSGVYNLRSVDGVTRVVREEREIPLEDNVTDEENLTEPEVDTESKQDASETDENEEVEVLDRGQEVVMVLEDDIRFEPYFRQKLMGLLEETRRLSIDWDLIYLGRKRLGEADGEEWVVGSKQLVWTGYSYWTLGYLLSSSGARKLVEGRPLPRLLPVDEYLPAMSDRHPEESWKAHFSPRDLHVLPAAPLLLFPTHYTGEQGYVSDTEDSLTEPSSSPLQRDDL